jgi:outer membrane protein OmpA-like peptidoglycan-associated protein
MYLKALFCMRNLLLILLLGIQIRSFAQTTRTTAPAKVVKALDKAMNLSRSGDGPKALIATEKVIKMQADLVDAWLLKANLHTEAKQWPEAESAYEKAIALKAEYYVQAYRLVAQTEWEQDKYAECAAHARQFLSATTNIQKIEPGVKATTLRMAENAEFAEGAIKKPVNYKREILSEAINTPDPEYLPSLTADGRYLLFTRREQNRDENYFISERRPEGWLLARPVDELNTRNLEGAASLSADGQFMVFSSEDRGEQRGEGGFDIWYAPALGKGRFGTAAQFGKGINSPSFDGQPCLSSDGRELWFTSNRPGGKGGKDIYMSKKEGEKFGAAIPMTVLNTPFEEQVPFLHPDGQTLYFTSNGWPGMGDQDIFFSHKQPDGTWSAPTNLGYPINTKQDEGSLFVQIDGKIGYYASREVEKGQKHDLYQLEIPPHAQPKEVTYVQGRVIDADTKKRIKAKLKIVQLSTNTTTEITEGADGFLVCLPVGEEYAFYTEKEGYLYFSRHYSLKNSAILSAPEQIEIALTPIPKATAGIPQRGSSIILRNLLFETGSAQIRAESETEIQAVYQFMQSNPDLRIKLAGHTDDTGSAESNQKLSEARAKALYDALIKRGISVNRMKYVGLGETQPIAGNDTELGKSQNRRTELVIE